MVEIYVRAKRELNYNASRFLQMLDDQRGLSAAKMLLAAAKPSDGFTKLWESGRLDLSVEAYVLREEFAPLFTEEERLIAKSRLEQYGWQSQ
jgi:hypothetical protein